MEPVTCPLCHKPVGEGLGKLELTYFEPRNWWVFRHWPEGASEYSCARAVFSLKGTTANHTIPVEPNRCDSCDGIGYQSGAHSEALNACPTCNGTGKP